MRLKVFIIIVLLPFLFLKGQVVSDTTSADNYFKKAETLMTAAKYDSSKALFEQASQIYLANNLLKKHFRCEFRIISIYTRERKLIESLDKIKLLKEKSIQILGENNDVIPQCYFLTGNINLQQQKYSDALENYQTALRMQIKLYGENGNDVGDTYNNIGNTNFYLSDFIRAIDYWKKSLKIRINKYGPISLQVSDSYNNIAYAYQVLSEYDSSLSYYSRSIEIRKKLFGEKHVLIGDSYNNLGVVYYEMSDYSTSLDYYTKALKIRKAIHGEHSAEVSDCYNNIGNVYYSTAQYDLSLEYFYKSLDIRKTSLGERHSLVAESYDNIGSVYVAKKDYSKSLEFHLKALELFKSILGENNVKIAENFNNLGIDYKNIGEYNKSLSYYNMSLKSYTELLGEKHLRVSEALNNIATLYFEQKEYDQALEYDMKALVIQKQLLGDFNQNVIVSYNGIADAFKAKKEYQTAMDYYQQAIAANLRTIEKSEYYASDRIANSINYSELIKSLLAKAETILEMAELNNSNERLLLFEKALPNYLVADKVIQNARKNLSNKDDKIALGTIASNVYEKGIALCFRILSINKKADSLKTIAYNFSEQGKSAVLYSLMMKSDALKFSNIPDSLIKKENMLQALKTNYSKQLAESEDSTDLAMYRSKLFETNRQYDDLWHLFESDYKNYFNLKYNTEIVRIEDLQKTIDSKTSIISYFFGTEKLFTFSLGKEGLSINECKLDSFLIKSITAYNYSLKAGEVESFNKESKNLFRQLVKPVLSGISKKTDLVIIPDGLLHKIPFETFSMDAAKKKQNYLVNRFKISYAPSVTMFYKGILDKESTPSNKALSFAGMAPVFASHTSNLLAENVYRSMDTVMRSSMLNKNGFLQELPFSKNEVENAFRLFGGKKNLYLGNEATETTFKSLLKSNTYQIVHLSTHGFSNELYPELSCLAFTNTEDSTIQDDGFLFTGETYNLDMKGVELLVLSSCESGIGKVEKGEGMLTLTRGFLYAGAKNLIQSLWKINDKFTSDFMTVFYNKLVNKNLSFKSALQAAKLEMINKGVFPGLWSAFILIEN